MARGDYPRREAKKPKKKEDKRPVLTTQPTEFVPAEVEVIKKRRKPREEEEEE